MSGIPDNISGMHAFIMVPKAAWETRRVDWEDLVPTFRRIAMAGPVELRVSFDVDEDDAREVWDIPEICEWCADLVENHPVLFGAISEQYDSMVLNRDIIAAMARKHTDPDSVVINVIPCTSTES